eukprot:CAMPEP_0197688480 /NCGR_PEP_ID=MMETSP1338-20131121/105508_1 /TAXON_ID=43686 ORGANISM="Pelagodinium beii, Strain RCC1491" /NCGR_SAMPLE_ID=MMETSP1338 /ASSEMBLY_ACC=CAM_ASM_000754 /LENGTH=103 /DNA_ID=CAMNT_0043270695 /DNA_START=60 /DNA_END=370 /DNA_ORIENTATION=-
MTNWFGGVLKQRFFALRNHGSILLPNRQQVVVKLRLSTTSSAESPPVSTVLRLLILLHVLLKTALGDGEPSRNAWKAATAEDEWIGPDANFGSAIIFREVEPV